MLSIFALKSVAMIDWPVPEGARTGRPPSAVSPINLKRFEKLAWVPRAAESSTSSPPVLSK